MSDFSDTIPSYLWWRLVSNFKKIELELVCHKVY